MNISRCIELRQSYIHVLSTGCFTLPEANSSFLRIMGSCFEHRLSKVLVDCRSVQGGLSISDAFQYGKFISFVHKQYADNGIFSMRFAYLAPTSFSAAGKAAEIAARNQSLELLVTTNQAEAFRWLGVDAAEMDQH
jgi:hypothetical protein